MTIDIDNLARMSDPVREAFEKWRDTKPHMSPLSVWQAAWQQSRREVLMEAKQLIPSNWCDAHLSGPNGIGSPPYDCRHIELLLNKIHADISAAAEEG